MNTLDTLKELSATMKLWSDTAGDHHWQAHLAIERLIKLERNNHKLLIAIKSQHQPHMDYVHELDCTVTDLLKELLCQK